MKIYHAIVSDVDRDTTIAYYQSYDEALKNIRERISSKLVWLRKYNDDLTIKSLNSPGLVFSESIVSKKHGYLYMYGIEEINVLGDS